MNKNKYVSLNNIGKDTVVLIEFWATWCTPCIQAFPHLNELSKIFSKDKIIFLSVTYERDEEKLTSFLAKHLLETPIALDTSLKMYKDYNAWAIPQTLIIDKGRNIVVCIHPEKITKEIIANVLLGNPINIPNNGKNTYFDPKGAEEYFKKLEKEGKD